MKIAIPIDENGILDGHFGHCKYFALFTVEGKKVTGKETVTPPPHEPGLLPKWLAERKVTDVLAGGMGQRAINIFNSNKVNVFVGAPRVLDKELVQGFLDSTIEFSANCCSH